jgi:hypothetical protein
MAIRIKSPVNSFVQFDEVDEVRSCEIGPFSLCLPVFSDNDVNFQFILQTDTEGEADALCDLHNALITIGIAEDCSQERILDFEEKPERFRIGTTSVLYNWQNGLPGFATVIAVAQCFIVKITIQGIYTVYDFCSGCFQRIGDTCHTSVIEYGNEDNAFGFDYCGGSAIDEETSVCDPLFVQFTNQANIVIPYTTQLQNKYGAVPDVQVWIYDDVTGDLVDMGVRASFDGFPPTNIKVDFGGFASGVIKIG